VEQTPIRWIDSVEESSKKCRWSKQKGLEKGHWHSQGWNQAVAPTRYFFIFLLVR